MAEACFSGPQALADWLPEPPAFDASSAAWMPLELARAIADLSPTGFDKLRQRLGKKFEHKGSKGHVHFYGPCWLRLWMFEQHGITNLQ